MLVKITQISETNYTEGMTTGEIEIDSIQSLAAKTNGEVVGNTIRCEWGNGEGYDEFEIEVIEPDSIETELASVMTASEVDEVYGLGDGTTRQACNRGQIRFRKSGGTLLIHRKDADAKWRFVPRSHDQINNDLVGKRFMHNGKVFEVRLEGATHIHEDFPRGNKAVQYKKRVAIELSVNVGFGGGKIINIDESGSMLLELLQAFNIPYYTSGEIAKVEPKFGIVAL